MGLIKRFLEEVAEEMGERDIGKPEVLAEAQRRLDKEEAAREVVAREGKTWDKLDERDKQIYLRIAQAVISVSEDS